MILTVLIASGRKRFHQFRPVLQPERGAVDDEHRPSHIRQTLLHAKSIAYSDSASGVYIKNEMFRKLGIEDQVGPKATMIPRIPVASVVASGEYEIGFQQVAELLPVAGVEFVGKVPDEMQSVTRYAAGIPVGSKHPDEARALLQFLASPAAQPTVSRTGLDPVAH